MHADKKKQAVQARTMQSPGFDMGVGQFKTPPAFGLSATAQMKPKEEKDPLPMRAHRQDAGYGPEEKGPISVQGAGDTHAFAKTDVNQGMLGDCYLLSSLMTLAQQNPSLLEKAISGPKADGTYNVTLYKRKGRGKNQTFTPQTITVNSSFVVDKVTGSNYYAQGGDKNAEGKEEMWVRLIEKAYGKMHGSSFDKIDGGFEEVALEILTGQPHTQHDFNQGREKMTDGDLKQGILDALKSGKAVTCSTYHQRKIGKLDKQNDGFGAKNEIVGWHAYAVVAANEHTITVRNPWGEGAATPEPILTWAQFRQYFSEFTTQD